MSRRTPRGDGTLPRRSATSPASPVEPDQPMPRRTASARPPLPKRSALTPAAIETTVIPVIREPLGSDKPAAGTVPRRSADSPDDADGTWRNVTKQTASSRSASEKPPIPKPVKLIGIGLIVVLLVAAAWLGLSMGGFGQQPTEQELWELKPPVQVGDFVAGTPKNSEEGETPQSVTVTYSDGTSKFIVVLSRPQEDLDTLLSDTHIAEPEVIGEASCGTAEESQLPTCVRVVDSTAILVAGMSGQDHATLADLVETLYTTMKR